MNRKLRIVISCLKKSLKNFLQALGMIQALDMLDASPGWDMNEPITKDILLQFFNEAELAELRYSEYS